jgi:four helix bundle protein
MLRLALQWFRETSQVGVESGMQTIRSYRDLTVWQRSVELFVVVTELAKSLPSTDRYVFEVQVRRAARSISSNIAEGNQRTHLGDYLKHVSYARGSLAEVETDLVLIERTVAGSATRVAKCRDCADEVGRMLTNLRTSLRRRTQRKRGT